VKIVHAYPLCNFTDGEDDILELSSLKFRGENLKYLDYTAVLYSFDQTSNSICWLLIGGFS